MTATPYRILTDWRIKARLPDVIRLLTNVQDLPNWWGSVYKSTVQTGPATFAIRSKGLLPLPLRWQLRVVEAALPHRWVTEATGDVNGRAIWHLRQAGEVVEVECDWQPSRPPLLAGLTSSSHRWSMAQGKTALYRELDTLGSLPPLPNHTTYPTGLPAIQ